MATEKSPSPTQSPSEHPSTSAPTAAATSSTVATRARVDTNWLHRLPLEVNILIFGNEALSNDYNLTHLDGPYAHPAAMVLETRKPSLVIGPERVANYWQRLTTATEDWKQGEEVSLRANPGTPSQPLLELFKSIQFEDGLQGNDFAKFSELLKLRTSKFDSLVFHSSALTAENELWKSKHRYQSPDLKLEALNFETVQKLLTATEIEVDITKLSDYMQLSDIAVKSFLRDTMKATMTVYSPRHRCFFFPFLAPSSAYTHLTLEIVEENEHSVDYSSMMDKLVLAESIAEMVSDVPGNGSRSPITIHNLLKSTATEEDYETFTKKCKELYCELKNQTGDTRANEVTMAELETEFDRLIRFTAGIEDGRPAGSGVVRRDGRLL